MEVKPGYKQTEVGVFPQDWEVWHISEIGSTYGGLTGKTKADFGVGDARYISFMNVMTNVVIDTAAFEHVRVSPGESQNRVCRGDLLFNGSSETPEEVAMCSLMAHEVPNLFLNSFCFGFRLQAAQQVDGLFLAYYLRANPGRELMKSLAQGSTRYNLSKVALLAASICLPPLPEQRAITAALSDVDALLNGLDRLIAKKRDVKQAAMQQLLTGQTRLPGFDGEWEVKRLGEVAEIISGGTPRTNEPSHWNGGIKWCTPTDITHYAGKYLTETERTISRTGLNNSGASLLPVGALLLCSRATIGELKIAGTPISTNQGFKSLVCRPDVSNEFLYYKLLTMKQHMIKHAFGSTFLEISTRNVSALEIAVPPVDEQTAIAAVLSDMDAELAALEARRDKTRSLKQAMMQELLTGRTRLV